MYARGRKYGAELSKTLNEKHMKVYNNTKDTAFTRGTYDELKKNGVKVLFPSGPPTTPFIFWMEKGWRRPNG